MFHEGQFEGRKVRLPVFLGRRPDEPVDTGLLEFYGELLKAIDAPAFRDGEWQLCERSGWPDNSSFLNLVAWCWMKGDARYLVIVNLSENKSDGQLRVPFVAGKTWVLTDLMSGAVYERDAGEMLSPGLYVELGAWEYNLFQCRVKR